MDDLNQQGEGQEAVEPQAEPQESQSEQSFNKEDYIPKQRFNEVYGKYKAYSEFGDPDTLRKDREELQRYRQAVEQYNRQQGQKADPETDAIKKRLFEVAPELKSVVEEFGSVKEMMQAVQAATLERNMERASDYLSNTLKQSGLELTAEEQGDLEDIILQRMTAQQRKAFEKGDFSTVNEILEGMTKRGIMARLTAKQPPKTPIRHGQSGMKPRGESKAKTLDEAMNEGWSRLSEG